MAGLIVVLKLQEKFISQITFLIGIMYYLVKIQ